MNLLLTNDDGYQSQGLKLLAEKLSEKHKVFVVAPDSNRSAVSHHYTMYSENTIKFLGNNWWNCSGYPADCVFAGLSNALFPEKIDAVVAGINYGPNLGTDIIYSGTCAAARQSILLGVPAIAVSVDPIDWGKAQKEGFKFGAMTEFILNNLENLLSMAKLEYPRGFINVNGASLEKYKGVKIVSKTCMRSYNDRLDLIPQEDGSYKTKLVYGIDHPVFDAECDRDVCHDGYITVSGIYADPISYPLEDNKGLFV